MARLHDIALPVLAAAVVGAFFLSERITAPKRSPGPIRITYWEKWTGFEGDAMRKVVNDFNKSQDRIFVDMLTVSDIGNKTMLSVSAGIPPDVAGLFGQNVSQYADDNAVMPLDDLCREAGIKAEDYVPAYWRIVNYRGRVMALPSAPAANALHYNKAIFRKHGLDPEKPPRTIEELTAMADKLTVKGRNGLNLAGFLPAEPGWWNWGWGYLFGGRLWNGKDRLTVNSPENIRAFEWVQSFSKKYGPSEVQTFKSGFGNFSSPQNAFMSEKVAMVLQGVWMHNFIHMYAPKTEWAAAPFPVPADRPDLQNTTFVDLDVLVIPNGAKHPREAFEFIKYVQSQKGMETLCLLQRKNSPLNKVSEEFWAKHENPYIRLFDRLAHSPNAVQPPQLAMWTEVQTEMNTAFDEVGLLRKTPKQALDDVQARMQPKLDQYLRRLELRRRREK